MKRKVVVFTGAGISQESGVKTFRNDNNGIALWDQFKVSEVATPNALRNNTKVFCDFYNMRKNELKTIQPNQAHLIAAELEKNFDVTVITQNVDNLHEKAGSSNVYHLHGDLTKLRSSFNPAYVVDYVDDIKPGDICPEGAQMRPDVVLFGESLPYSQYEKSLVSIGEADVIIIVGTSMQVYPAADMPWTAKETALIYYIDPNDVGFEVPEDRLGFFSHIQEKASIGMDIVKNDIMSIYC